MPKDYDPAAAPLNGQRRPHLALGDAEIRALLSRLPVGHVATAWDGQPFINPTTFWYGAERHAIVFHSNLVGRVRANSERHPRVCFEASAHGPLLALQRGPRIQRAVRERDCLWRLPFH
ncbi:MAG: pyridoxamine 5'-phosphate oxidase family protein [Anaerolineales bacterium]|nr:pyridoxamine 5'-phosphate oxidase family protein [Anaerolineales bacterium]